MGWSEGLWKKPAHQHSKASSHSKHELQVMTSGNGMNIKRGTFLHRVGNLHLSLHVCEKADKIKANPWWCKTVDIIIIFFSIFQKPDPRLLKCFQVFKVFPVSITIRQQNAEYFTSDYWHNYFDGLSILLTSGKAHDTYEAKLFGKSALSCFHSSDTFYI